MSIVYGLDEKYSSVEEIVGTLRDLRPNDCGFACYSLTL
jgi:hypothetical protein